MKRIKQVFSLLVVLSLLLSLTACGGTTPKEPDTPTTPTVVLQDQMHQTVQVVHYDWAEDLPRMDGSTSTIPLEAGIRAALFGLSQEEAELQVTHSTTYGSFYNLIDKKCDLIFSVPLSDKQIQQARDKGMELQMTKIAAEGFVFVVNAQNPVNTLTQQQLRDIYSGKITNWSEVGGNDAPIIAYQRNETSGSQNFMHTFMGDTELMDPLTSASYTPSGMGELMDAIAVYDNAENAIGYSVYAYAADMYGNGNEIKFIHVDGVEPTKATMADGSYPLLSYNYAVYDKTTPADSSLRKLVEWIGTDEGQRAIKAAGYIPLRPVGDVAETVVRLYNATGTGPEKPADHTPSLVRYVVTDTSSVVEESGDAHQYKVPHLTNTELAAEIESFINDAQAEMCDPSDMNGADVSVECINGYLSVKVCVNSGPTDARTAIYDLVAGKRIAFSDLFYKDVKYVSALNADLANQVGKQTLHWVDTSGETVTVDQYPTKRPFVGIPAGHDTFTLTAVVFPKNNLYFEESLELSFRGLYSQMVLSEARDMSGLFDESVTVERELAKEAAFVTKERLIFGEWAASLLDPAQYDADVCDKINIAIRGYCTSEFSKEELVDAFARTYHTEGAFFVEGASISLFILADRYVSMVGGTMAGVSEKAPRNGETTQTLFVHYSVQHFFDLQTGEEIPYTTFLKDGWQEQGEWTRCPFVVSADGSGDREPIDRPDLTGAVLKDFEIWGGKLNLVFGYSDLLQEGVQVTLPLDCVNWEA